MVFGECPYCSKVRICLLLFFFIWIAGLCTGFQSNKIYQFKMLTKKKVELDLVGYGSQRCSLFTSCNPLKGAKVQLKIHARARNFFF